MIYPNTTFRDGMKNTFAVGTCLDGQGDYPMHVACEDFSVGVGSVMLTASYDGGARSRSWRPAGCPDNPGK